MIEVRPNQQLNMTVGYQVTDADRLSRGIYNKTVGDRVVPERLDGGIILDFGQVKSYIEFFPTATPSTPSSDIIRLYHKSSGSSTKLYVLNDAGVEGELLTSASVSLDTAYSNGSTIDVDTTDVIWRLSAARNFRVTNAADSVTYLQTSPTRTDIAALRINTAYTLPSADGSANQFIRTNGAGTLSFASLSTLGDSIYLRLDGTNDPITGDIQISANLGVGTVPAALFHEVETASTGTVNPAQLITGAAHTALTASTERHSVRWNFGQTEQWATGALATERVVRIDAPTLAAVGASTFTDAMTVAITSAPVKGTNVTLTNTHALHIAAGAVSTATNSYGLTVNAQTGATNNYTAQFVGGETVFGGLVQTTRTTQTIATGVITVTSSYTEVDTEGAGASDDLDTINGGNIGDILILEAANDARTVVVKNGTGNIYLNGAADRALDDGKDKLLLIRHASTEWHEIAFSSNA